MSYDNRNAMAAYFNEQRKNEMDNAQATLAKAHEQQDRLLAKDKLYRLTDDRKVTWYCTKNHIEEICSQRNVLTIKQLKSVNRI